MSKPFTAGRRTVAVLVCLIVALAMAVALLAVQLVKSPQQVQADAAPPPPSVITAPVEFRVLRNDLVTRGLVAPERSVVVNTAGRAGEGGIALVTGVRARTGAQVKAGDVLLEVSGRPVFVLEGEVPAYRDLRPGAHGKDVTQLQRALTGAGHQVAETSTFDAATSKALGSLYTAIGYDAPPATTAGADGAAVEGIMLPISEVVFLPQLPARVRNVKAAIGSASESASVTLAAGKLGVTASLQPIFATSVQPGQPAQLCNEALDSTVEGTVESVAAEGAPADQADEDDSGAPTETGPTARIVPKTPLPESWDTTDIRVTITAASSSAETLVVPVTALYTTQDGRTRVEIVAADGTRTQVEVRPGLTGGGFAEVHPVTEGALKMGDAVLVGLQQQPQDPAGPADVPSDEPS